MLTLRCSFYSRRRKSCSRRRTSIGGSEENPGYPRLKGESRRRSSSFNIVGATASKKRSDNKFNSAYVNDEHLIHDGVHIEKNSTCFGESNSWRRRTELFHILESSCMRMSVIGLLIVDVICVFFEIMFYDRVITPSFSKDASRNIIRPFKLRLRRFEFCQEFCVVDRVKEYQLHAGEFSQFKMLKRVI